MADLQKQELIDYIKDVISIETDIATQEQIANDYAKVAEVRKPQYKPNPMPNPPQSPQCVTVFSTEKPGPLICAGFGIFAGITALGIFGQNAPYLSGSGIMNEIARENMGWVIGILIVSVLLFLPLIIKKKNADQENKQNGQNYSLAMEKHREKVDQIKSENAKAQSRYQEYLADWSHSHDEITSFLLSPIEESKAIRDSMYAKDIIYVKYRNLPALTSIYEYLVTGRCTELSGPNGAYNMYEDEVRKDTVISQLNTVIENLEQIRQNQYMLYQQVKAIQENTSTIASELRQIRGYTVQIAQLTALNTYYAALNERNTRITMYYHL